MKIVALLAALAAPLLAQSAPAHAADAPAFNGEQLFRQRCQACHQVVAGRPSATGPNLSGVVGRKAGAAAFSYSAALKGSNLTWTPAGLDQYLAAPARMVPGTRMVVSVTNPAQREAIIQYLSRTR
ncbi:MAG: c-type cytochrome [Sphingomonadaceae bacterium]